MNEYLPAMMSSYINKPKNAFIKYSVHLKFIKRFATEQPNKTEQFWGRFILNRFCHIDKLCEENGKLLYR